MSNKKLEQAYEAIELLKSLNLPVSREQLNAIGELERECIQKEIKPAVKKTVEAKIARVTTPFSFQVCYTPENGVTIGDLTFCNGRGLGQSRNAEHKKVKNEILRVTFPDGEVIEERKVSQTLAKCIHKIGWVDVQELNIMVVGINLVSNTLHENPRYHNAQIMIEDEVYVMTCSKTDVKYEQLKQISNRLKLHLKIDKVSI